MPIFAIGFLFGILLLQNFSSLPSKHLIWILIVFMLLTIKLIKRNKFIIGVICGFIWVLFYVYQKTAWTFPSDLEEKKVITVGYIASIPNYSNNMIAFLFEPQIIYFNNQNIKPNGLVKISLRFNEKYKNIHAGDKWQLLVRFKRIHGCMNPGSFDFEAYALQADIKAKGYIINSEINKLLESKFIKYPLNRIREFIKIKIENYLPKSNTSPWIIALVLGERQGIADENWDILRKTGTNHLMAIAGLHIGFMSSFAFGMVSWLWKLFPRLTLKIPAQYAGALAALFIGIIYSSLAGFLIPTQRACIMLSIFLSFMLLKRKMIAWYAWSLALICVLLINPLNVLTESFWLSFGAVAIIIYGVSARLSTNNLWWKWGRIQWIIALGLIPFSIWLFQQLSIVSFIANSITIPIVGFIIVPLSLIGTFILLFAAPVGAKILILADKILNFTWEILTYLANLSWGSIYQILPNYWILLISLIGITILLFPIGIPGRFFGIIWILPLFVYKVSTPKYGEVWFTLLDVGQGLATVVRTEKHSLVFDTGAKLGNNFDMGENVVLPFLRKNAIKIIDRLVISHGDNDHIGGSYSILKKIPVKLISTSVPFKFSKFATNFCLRNESWNWDGVNFKFLYPSKEYLNLGNDSSCVLQVESNNKKILLTGDIEKFAEKKLVELEGANLKADILIAPHHGSKTSGLNDFLQKIQPQYVLFPIGYRNRFHFPHATIIEKYKLLGSGMINTVEGGAINFVINNKGIISKPYLYRKENRKYWND